jgi:hypothetical protein
MRPLFTIHAGEYIAGSFIEQNFPNCRVWIPSRDTGIDLLVTDRACSRSVKLQVKFSKDFAPTHLNDLGRHKLRVCTWFRFKAEALRSSQADYWVLVLQSFSQPQPHFLVIKPQDLLSRVSRYRGESHGYDLYLWVNSAKRCWESRGLSRKDLQKVADDDFTESKRNYSQFLDNWKPLMRLNARS